MPQSSLPIFFVLTIRFRTRVGLILSISSFGLLFSALIQDGVLTPGHIWVIPSAVSGVSFPCLPRAPVHEANSRCWLIDLTHRCNRSCVLLEDFPCSKEACQLSTTGQGLQRDQKVERFPALVNSCNLSFQWFKGLIKTEFSENPHLSGFIFLFFSFY
jgi:hypothetical protein